MRNHTRVTTTLVLATVAAAITLLLAGSAHAPSLALAASTCADYPNQAAAQRAADTRDPDDDGIYCESLPCPCLTPEDTGTGGKGGTNSPAHGMNPPDCRRPSRVRRLVFSAREYPHIHAHFSAAVRRGWPRVLELNRPGAGACRERLLRDVPTRSGYDRDEYPPAVARGRGKGLRRGTHPRGWKADVRYVASSENRSHGTALGGKLERFCNGTRFRYVFR
jgi:Deoxyribonuclease NucA/NucB